MIPTVQMIEDYYRGVPPVAGGVYDQAAFFVNVARYWKREEMLVDAD